MEKVASATRLFSPPLSWPMGRKTESPARPSEPSALRPASVVVDGSSSRAFISTYSSAGMSSGSSCARSCTKKDSLAPSPSLRLPSSSGSVPAMLFISVDLPAPLGPSTKMRCPFSTVRFSPDSSGVPAQPTAASLSTTISRWQGGGGRKRMLDLVASPPPAEEAATGRSAALSRSRFSIFSRDLAALANAVLAPNFAMNASVRAISACAAVAAANCCSSRSLRMARKSV